MSEPTVFEEWQCLYEAVRAVCSEHGKEHAFGEGDFWVVDDCWGGVGQKVVVTTPSFLTPGLVSELSACVSRLGLLGAEIVVAIENEKSDAIAGRGGLVVHSAGFEEYWDIDALRSKYGNSFFT